MNSIKTIEKIPAYIFASLSLELIDTGFDKKNIYLITSNIFPNHSCVVILSEPTCVFETYTYDTISATADIPTAMSEDTPNQTASLKKAFIV